MTFLILQSWALHLVNYSTEYLVYAFDKFSIYSMYSINTYILRLSWFYNTVRMSLDAFIGMPVETVLHIGARWKLITLCDSYRIHVRTLNYVCILRTNKFNKITYMHCEPTFQQCYFYTT